ncbi:DUF397 domain-containing protein [Streptomyces sp. NPDC058739]|uniref:DUF397 domain-containing protein n=1 Tax=Streptomyces sp. NPDC058739 TaxID=3346618 RepID=UPI0036C24721
MAEATDPEWVTSSYSNGAGGECVECAFADGGTLVRDSKAVDAGVVTVTAAAWHAFVRALPYVDGTGSAARQ